MTTLILPGDMQPEGSRQLGVRTAPSLRLSIGFRNPDRNNAPDKLDYFRAKEGANGEFKAAAHKFHSDEGYGAKPRAIDIRLPARLEDAIRIEYLAFKGNPDDPAGGVMVARGETNFAPLGYCGGPDTLTVWNQDGTVDHVRTAGVDAITKKPLDKVAKDLDLMLCTTFRVGLPKVLGFGSFAEITSKSLRSTDQVWMKLRDWYAAFPNGTITFAMRPLLVVRPAFARPAIKTKDGIRRVRVKVYVLDVVQPESEDEMIARLEEYKGAVAPGLTPAAAVPVGELEAGLSGVAPLADAADEEIADGEIVEDPTDGRADSQARRVQPGADERLDGGSVEEAPGMGARTPEPTSSGPEPAATQGVSPPGPETIDAAQEAARSEMPPAEAATSGQQGPVADAGVSGVEQDELPQLASGDSSQQADREDPPPSVPGAPVDAEPVLEGVPAPVDDEVTSEDRALAEQAAKVKPPFGSYQNITLAAVLKNPNGRLWFEYAVNYSRDGKFGQQDAKFERLLWAFIKVHLPDLYAANKEHAK